MKADFSRISFDPAQQYIAVLHQQGRIITDADLNESAAIQAHQYESLAASLTGTAGAIWMEPPVGFPTELRHVPGFRIFGRAELGKEFNKWPERAFWISPGHYYAGGLRCENDAWVPLDRQPFWPLDGEAPIPPLTPLEGTGDKQPSLLLYLDAWERPRSALDDDHLADGALGHGVDTAMRTQLVWQVKAVDTRALDAGTSKPDSKSTSGTGSPADDVAAQLQWQRSRLPWQRTFPRLRVQCIKPAAAADLCRQDFASGLTALENLLYRVEIHTGTPPPATPDPKTGKTPKLPWPVTFKWSRENGSVVAKVTKVTGARSVTIQPSQLKGGGFRPNCVVEIVRDADELCGRPGALLVVEKVQGYTLTFKAPCKGQTLTMPSDGDKLRRWDQPPCEGLAVGVVHEWVNLENGIQVRFEPADDEPGSTDSAGGVVPHQPRPECFAGTDFHTGDYWIFAARTGMGKVEWTEESEPEAALASLVPKYAPDTAPVRPEGKPPAIRKGNPAPLRPHGVRHRCAPLAELKWDGKNWTLAPESKSYRIFRLCLLDEQSAKDRYTATRDKATKEESKAAVYDRMAAEAKAKAERLALIAADDAGKRKALEAALESEKASADADAAKLKARASRLAALVAEKEKVETETAAAAADDAIRKQVAELAAEKADAAKLRGAKESAVAARAAASTALAKADNLKAKVAAAEESEKSLGELKLQKVEAEEELMTALRREEEAAKEEAALLAAHAPAVIAKLVP